MRRGDCEFRVVRDRFAGLEVQRRKRGFFRWGPWLQGPVNTHGTIEAARAYAESWAATGSGDVVEHMGVLHPQPRDQQSEGEGSWDEPKSEPDQ